MNKTDHIKYWIDASKVDFKAMNNLFKSKDYVWSLFIGHLVIEKLIKAVAIKNGITTIPKIHDLRGWNNISCKSIIYYALFHPLNIYYI